MKTKATGGKRASKKGKAAKAETQEPVRASARPPAARKSTPPPPSERGRRSELPIRDEPEPEAAATPRWEERTDKDSYALDVLDRLVRYYAGRASASSDPAMRAAAEALNAVSFALAAGDSELLLSLGGAARQLVHGTPQR